ncbi:MAG: ABC transporter permease [Alphaproteobacteria bacterium]|nr:ABC transporter permease [Alphaproteobacteria bacterium]
MPPRAPPPQVSVVRNQVLFVLALVSAAAIAFTGFVSHAPNRLLSGQALPLWHAAPFVDASGVAAGVLALLFASILPQSRRLHWALVVIGSGSILQTLDAAGQVAIASFDPAHPAARTTLGPAAWILILCAALAITDAVQRLKAGPLLRGVVAGGVVAAVGMWLVSGRLDALSFLREYANQRDAFAHELIRHMALVAAALIPALAIGAPLGVAVARRPRLGQGMYAGLNLLQTIPSVALFGLLIAPLSALAAAFPVLAAAGVQGIGFFPAMLALVLYALLPVVRNTQAGLMGVDPSIVEAARGMGLTRRQIFWRVEGPLALPVFLAGVRIVLVQTIGLAVVAALIGAGGLGTFVFQGIGQYATNLVLLGAVPTIALALAADLVMRMLVDLAGRRRSR